MGSSKDNLTDQIYELVEEKNKIENKLNNKIARLNIKFNHERLLNHQFYLKMKEFLGKKTEELKQQFFRYSKEKNLLKYTKKEKFIVDFLYKLSLEKDLNLDQILDYLDTIDDLKSVIKKDGIR